MKTLKLASALTTLSLVLFLSTASIANTGILKTSDLRNSADNSLNISCSSEKDFSYLRFDVTKYSNGNDETDFTLNSLDYLRFDVNEYITENESEITELPAANDFEYLRFDVNKFSVIDSDNFSELPLNEFNHLRFDVNNFVTSGNDFAYELPVTE